MNDIFMAFLSALSVNNFPVDLQKSANRGDKAVYCTLHDSDQSLAFKVSDCFESEELVGFRRRDQVTNIVDLLLFYSRFF